MNIVEKLLQITYMLFILQNVNKHKTNNSSIYLIASYNHNQIYTHLLE